MRVVMTYESSDDLKAVNTRGIVNTENQKTVI